MGHRLGTLPCVDCHASVLPCIDYPLGALLCVDYRVDDRSLEFSFSPSLE